MLQLHSPQDQWRTVNNAPFVPLCTDLAKGSARARATSVNTTAAAGAEWCRDALLNVGSHWMKEGSGSVKSTGCDTQEV